MNNVYQNDLKLLELWNNENLKVNSEEVQQTRDYINTQTDKGRELVYSYMKGIPPFSKSKCKDQIFLSNTITQILYFHNFIIINKELFLSYHDIEKNKQLSDQCYIKFADTVKFLHELENTEIIDDLLDIVLQLKLGDKYTEENCKKIMRICHRQVGENLLKGKYIKSLSGFVPPNK